MCLIAAHDDPEDVDVARAVVASYRYLRRWYAPDGAMTVRQAIDRFLAWSPPMGPPLGEKMRS